MQNDDYSVLLEKAINIALTVHIGQKDKSGMPYILHVLRVMLRMDSLEEMIVAVLHDCIEDGNINIDYLLANGFPERITDAINLLTRSQNLNYESYIKSINLDELAKKVKIEDLKDNLNLLRLNNIGLNDIDRIKKYHKSFKFLTNVNIEV